MRVRQGRANSRCERSAGNVSRHDNVPMSCIVQAANDVSILAGHDTQAAVTPDADSENAAVMALGCVGPPTIDNLRDGEKNDPK